MACGYNNGHLRPLAGDNLSGAAYLRDNKFGVFLDLAIINL